MKKSTTMLVSETMKPFVDGVVVRSASLRARTVASEGHKYGFESHALYNMNL